MKAIGFLDGFKGLKAVGGLVYDVTNARISGLEDDFESDDVEGLIVND